MERIRSLFISDMHLGVAENNAASFFDIINKYEFDNLFLLGDIIDIKELQRKWRWKHTDTEVIHKIVKIAGKKNVIYITGNHERGFFDNFPSDVLPVKFRKEYIYNKMLLIHGDQFDNIIGRWKWLYTLGDWGYNLSIATDGWLKWFGFELRISKKLKHMVKKSVNYLSNFHEAACMYAKYNNCHTVICGHTHQHDIRKIKDIRYVNCGDLRQDKTYIIEELDGALKGINMETGVEI